MSRPSSKEHRGCLKATFDMPAWVGENHRVPSSMKTDKGLTTSERRTSLPSHEPLTQSMMVVSLRRTFMQAKLNRLSRLYL